MTGRNAFSDLTKDMTPERRARIEERKAELRAAMALRELRRTRGLTQGDVAAKLGVNQPAVAKLEGRADTTVSSLRAHVEALGGLLTLVAEMPDGDVVLTGFGERDAKEPQSV